MNYFQITMYKTALSGNFLTVLNAREKQNVADLINVNYILCWLFISVKQVAI